MGLKYVEEALFRIFGTLDFWVSGCWTHYGGLLIQLKYDFGWTLLGIFGESAAFFGSRLCVPEVGNAVVVFYHLMR